VDAVVEAYAAISADEVLAPFVIERREVRAQDVEIQILFCGVCHSDIHFARDEWKMTQYPCVPGHEIAGRVLSIGSGVTRFKTDDVVGVGCLVDSCHSCSACEEDLEQHCERAPVFTYNGEETGTGQTTYGGYSQRVVVDQAFVLKIPTHLDLAAAAPLLCAGITTYSPLKRFGAGPGKKVGVIGLGGLGHMAVKFAAALGAEVAVFTRSTGKVDDARQLGAREAILSSDAKVMDKYVDHFDLIVDTVSAQHDLNMYLNTLKRSGTLVLVGAPENPLPVAPFSLLFRRRQIAGSLIGGIKETQEMLDFCGEKNIVCEIELIKIQQINDAYERMLKSDVKYRFVIDNSSLAQ